MCRTFMRASEAKEGAGAPPCGVTTGDTEKVAEVFFPAGGASASGTGWSVRKSTRLVTPAATASAMQPSA